MHTLWSILRKISKIGSTKCQILKVKCTKLDFRWGSALDPAGDLTALPRPYLYLREPASNEKKRKGKGMRREGKREGRERREGRE